MSDDAGSALSRWSQRKHAARVAARGGAAPVPVQEPDQPPAAETQPTAAPDIQAKHPADTAAGVEPRTEKTPADARPPLTPIEELTAQSDYTQFLADHVPEALQRAALRKLWTSDPVLACLDGLNDYDEDFNVIDTVISAADTHYKVGRGYLDMEEPETAEAPKSAVAQSGDIPSDVHRHDAKADSDEAESAARPLEAAAGEDESPNSTHERVTSHRVADGPEDPQSDTPADKLPGSTG